LFSYVWYLKWWVLLRNYEVDVLQIGGQRLMGQKLYVAVGKKYRVDDCWSMISRTFDGWRWVDCKMVSVVLGDYVMLTLKWLNFAQLFAMDVQQISNMEFICGEYLLVSWF